jgi:hypothetical protein
MASSVLNYQGHSWGGTLGVEAEQRDDPVVAFLHVPRQGTARDVVRAFARYLLDETACSALPVSLNAICKHLRIPVKRQSLPGQRGFTTADRRIYLNAGDRETVQKFTAAHEVMEVLCLAVEEGAADDWMRDDVIAEFSDRKESLCEMGAAELVMPPHLFCAVVRQQRVDLARACDIARQCQVSLTATVWRIIELELAPLVLIVWQRKHKPTEYVPSQVGQLNLFGTPHFMDPPKLMRVERVFVPPGFTGFIPPGKSVPSESVVDQAFTTGVTTCAFDDLTVGPLRGWRPCLST